MNVLKSIVVTIGILGIVTFAVACGGDDEGYTTLARLQRCRVHASGIRGNRHGVRAPVCGRSDRGRHLGYGNGRDEPAAGHRAPTPRRGDHRALGDGGARRRGDGHGGRHRRRQGQRPRRRGHPDDVLQHLAAVRVPRGQQRRCLLEQARPHRLPGQQHRCHQDP